MQPSQSRGKRREGEAAKGRPSTLKRAVLRDRAGSAQERPILVTQAVPPPIPRDLSLVARACGLQPSKALDDAVERLLTKLAFFQSRDYGNDAMSAQKRRMRRRMILGLRQVHQAAQAHGLRLVVVATDLEPAEALLSPVRDLAAAKWYGKEGVPHNVPLALALTKRRLGKVLERGSGAKISFVGVYRPEGATDELTEVMAQIERSRHALWRGGELSPLAKEFVPIDSGQQPKRKL
uniref:Ribosomal protein L7Ae/L30e/S12e/Gadd45 domain-containing protein n=1 Tax=Compsopogon caeruleus TaxID=31354 RepID=A0A7S1XD20_9RHOD|mmetsp:Transcript_18083/g.37541  ORF Transcript_18083/g.37541 Transcript_18083/m.37541 type:complete len:236 (+) Transcript_18083:174-881(+)